MPASVSPPLSPGPEPRPRGSDNQFLRRGNRMPASKGKIFNDLTAAIGNTPLVRLSRLTSDEGVQGELLAKLEFFNPTGSVKDRIGVAMIDGLERDGKIGPETVLIEPTSGNTGIALAFVAAVRRYRLILVMPANVSRERRRMLRLLGAELVLTSPNDGMRGAVTRAEELHREMENSVIPQQFANPANPSVHAATTAREIWRDTDGRLDGVVAGIGTGGTLMGITRAFRMLGPSVRMVGVEPASSPVLSGGKPGPHLIEGIGAGFVPAILDPELLDEVITVRDRDAVDMARKLARIEGVAGGLSTGAAVHAALALMRRSGAADRRMVVIVPSFAERYLSTALFEGLG